MLSLFKEVETLKSENQALLRVVNQVSSLKIKWLLKMMISIQCIEVMHISSRIVCLAAGHDTEFVKDIFIWFLYCQRQPRRMCAAIVMKVFVWANCISIDLK